MSPAAPTFARLLAAGRGEFNARVAQTRSRVPTFDADAFAAFLRAGVAPLVEAVAVRVPDAAASCAVAAFDLALELVARRLVGSGARSPLITRTWSELLPVLATNIASAPLPMISALSHAALHLDAVPGARGDEWIERMTRLGPRAASRDELLAVGQVLAWTCGMSHFRSGALEKLSGLSPALARDALGAPASQSLDALCAHLQADRWYSPDGTVTKRVMGGVEIGSFTGFGGSFPEPPKVRAAGEDFVVRSGDRHFWLMVDAYGWTLHPVAPADFDQASATATTGVRLDGLQLVEGTSKRTLEGPTDGLSVSAGPASIAISTPLSHRLRVFPRLARAA